jgi:hypothetical protein
MKLGRRDKVLVRPFNFVCIQTGGEYARRINKMEENTEGSD